MPLATRLQLFISNSTVGTHVLWRVKGEELLPISSNIYCEQTPCSLATQSVVWGPVAVLASSECVRNAQSQTLPQIRSDQIRSVAQSCPTLCNPMNRSTPGLPVHHQFPEFTQTHVHRVSDAIQLSHPLSSPSPPAPNPSQHQGLFQ